MIVDRRRMKPKTLMSQGYQHNGNFFNDADVRG